MQLRKKITKAAKLCKRAIDKSTHLKFIYGWHYKHSKLIENQVLFESFHGKDVSDSPFYILKALLEMDESKYYNIYFSTNNYEQHKKTVEDMGLPIKLVDISTYKYTKVLATSKYLINNSSFPAYFIRREEQIYLQTWHGTPLKTLGKKMRFGIESMYNVQHNFLQANYILFPNEFTQHVIMEDYNLNTLYTGKVIMSGYPRNSIFMDKKKAYEVTQELKNENYTTLAYMPTWRGQSNHDIKLDDYEIKINHMLTYLDKNMENHQKLYVNFHPIVQQSVKLDNFKHIFPFPSDIDKYEFLNSVDGLITDYSSVFFDYSVTRKPIILFMYDYDEYMHDRGMYFNVKDLPFRMIYDIETLKDCIVSEDFRDANYSKDTNYTKKFIPYDSIDAGQKLAELIFRKNESNLLIIDYGKNQQRERNIVFPPGIKTTADVDSLAKSINSDKDIVIFEKRFFNPTMSSYLYDNYPDNFDYVFITKTVPRTIIEEILSHKSTKIQDRLQKREAQRCFPGLNIDWHFQREYYHGEKGETFFQQKIDCINCKIFVENQEFHILYDESPHLSVTKLLLVDSKRNIIWTRKLTKKEHQQQKISESFRSILDDKLVIKNGRYKILLETQNKSDGYKRIYYPRDIERFQKVQPTVDYMDQSSLYLEPLIHRNTFFQDGLKKNAIAVVPYQVDNLGVTSLLICLPEDITGKYTHGKIMNFSTKGSTFKIKMKFKKRSSPIIDVAIIYRSAVENIKYSIDYTLQEKNDFWIIQACIDMSKITLKELYWDIYILTKEYGNEVRLSPYLNKWQRLKLLLMNYECKADSGHIIYPYRTKGLRIAFSYRQRSKYDGYTTKLKELSALAVYALLLPYWKKKRMWLVFEKFCSMAQDNGFYFFKYCMENLPAKEKEHIYFILDKESADWDKMKKYKKNVIPFMSFKHILYCMVAKLYIASDSKTHLYAWRAKPNLVSQRISKHNILFLQHGVTALKRVDSIFGKYGSSPMTYFTTTSEFEQKIVCKYFGYALENAPILGFTRWDVLEDTSSKNEKIILAMPTWRSWLEEKSPEDFMQSDYYYNYMHFLQNKKLSNLLENEHVELIFYIHPKFKGYLDNFNINEKNIKLIPFGSVPLNELIKKCSMLITDYSSVCWDVYYLGKPVLFYQFDYDMYMQAHGSYLNMNNELFGDRYLDCDQLIKGIEEYVVDNFKEKKDFASMRDYFFAYHDKNNSKRTYEYIISKEY